MRLVIAPSLLCSPMRRDEDGFPIKNMICEQTRAEFVFEDNEQNESQNWILTKNLNGFLGPHGGFNRIFAIDVTITRCLR